MALYKIKKGRNLQILGKPERVVEGTGRVTKVAFLPTEFEGVKFKLEVGEGDSVEIGTPLLSSRANPDLLFTSPAGGKVAAVVRGEKRKLMEIVIDVSEGEEKSIDFGSHSTEDIKKLERGEIIEKLLKSGLWPSMIQRPFSRIADATVTPKSIFVNAMDTEPNCADKQLLLEGRDKEFQAGLSLLNKLTEGKVFLCYDGNAENVSSAVVTTHGVETHQFAGAHPAGNVGTHIAKLDRIRKGDVVWHINAEKVADWGKLFLTGARPIDKIVALGGSSATKARYYKTRVGAPIESVVQGNVKEGDQRVISGGVLSGKTTHMAGFVGYNNTTITVIPEGKGKELFGWMKPGMDKPTFTKLFLSALTPDKKFEMNTKVNGEPRAIVASHVYDPLVALDVYTTFLVKACMAKDIERMEELGILECAPEDFTLCTYACVSKIEVDHIIKEGLELVEKES